MKRKYNQVYEFKIWLKEIRPMIWRKIQVPETYTFWDLHVAIQDAMGWLDYHLHNFEILRPSTGIKAEIGFPDEEMDYGRVVLAGWRQKINEWFDMKNRTAEYVYDYGDFWVHVVRLEKVLPRDRSIKYPLCVSGKLACPPEDCGGVMGYYELCSGESDFAEHFPDYDPEYFDPKKVIFDDPDKRWKEAFEED